MLRSLCLCLIVGGVITSSAAAESLRFRFAPSNPPGSLVQVPAGPNGALGEKLNGFGLVPQPFTTSVRPNQMVTIRHPYSGRNVVVPLTLPNGTPRIEHRTDSVVFNYGSYTTDVRFFPDGVVDVIYNSGFLRPLVLE